MATLYVVATPIGNLEDLTERARRVLGEVDQVLCEDTRHTLQLLNHLGVRKPLLSYHQHSQVQKVDQIIELLRQEKNLALVSDAGTPGLSDPGGVLVAQVVRQLGDAVRIEPVPGPTALGAIIAVAGLPTDRFLFLGFLPHQKGRRTLFEEIKNSERTVVFYESTHRILKALVSLAEILEPDRPVVVGRELTKKFETIYRGTASEVLKQLEAGETRGEFVVVVAGRKK